jgi:hypothetical protein
MKFPPELVNEIKARLDQAKKLYPAAFSTDRNALLVDGSIGYDCYVTPDGDVFMETYEPLSDEPPVIDRSRSAQIQVLVLGSRNIPMLAEMLPKRPPEAPACEKCNGSGRLHQELRQTFGNDWEGFLCDECYGLGWIEVA